MAVPTSPAAETGPHSGALPHLRGARLAGSIALFAVAAALAIGLALLIDFDVGRGSELRMTDLRRLLDPDSTLFQFRLPRVLGGAVVGAALAGAGAAFQAA